MKTHLALAAAAAAAAALVQQVEAVTAAPAPVSSPELINPIDTTNAKNTEPYTDADTHSYSYVQKQIEWLKSKKGGFFSPKIMYGIADKEDTSFSGMFALAPIAKGEEIIHLPVEHFITSSDIDNASDNDNDSCVTAMNLAKEYYKGNESSWEPYVTYCFESFPHEHLPPNWSEEAIQLFQSIIGTDLEPHYLGTIGSYAHECSGHEEDDEDEPGDEILEAAYRIVVARGWNDILLPVVDMINHRNGKWYNVDQTGSAHIGEDVSIVALRDIDQGEQIYLSYNECLDEDCWGIAHIFTMPQLLAIYGFVEQYPRRFNIGTQFDAPVFELDDEDDEAEVKITWLDGEPKEEDLDWFRDQLGRLQELKVAVMDSLEDLESHEQNTIHTYYQTMLEGLELASSWSGRGDSHDIEEEECAEGDETCSAAISSRKYGALEDHEDALDYSVDLCSDPYIVPGREVSKEEFRSIYQDIEFKHFNDINGNKVDTCLYLNGYIHTCNSLRPHYHEWCVHYPAQFLKQVKRVLFLGGGDNMILHEVLKYPDLELVVGMELDQMVVRGSFKHFKTEPHYDDGRVQWWFGDAAMSLRMLPDEYLGTFDLVVVDLATYVTESLMVTDELNILDFCMLLLNKDGVLTMNEDFIAPTKADNAQFTVDLEIMEVPVFCEQSINMLSNNIDFMTAEPIDHGIESMVVKPGAAKSDSQKFDSWWNYHRNVQHNIKERKAAIIDASDNSQGVMIVLEAEDVTLSMDSLMDANDTITETLKKAGLTILSSSSFRTEALFIGLKEGYVMLRSWPEYKYCAFDLVLWGSLDKLDAVKAGLMAIVGAKSTSSFKIVTGGMRGVESIKVSKFPVETDYDTSTCTDPDAISATVFELGDLGTITEEMFALIQSAEPVTVVFCSDKVKSCRSLDLLNNGDATRIGKVFPVWAASENAALVVMKSALSHGKIDGIVIDPEAPREMGQVLKQVLYTTSTRKQLLAMKYVVLAPTLDSSESSWRSSLLEWFRTDVAMQTPDYHAEVLFSSATRSGNLKVGIFSAGDEDFYPHLVEVIDKCESRTGFVTKVPSVQDGMLKFMSNFDPPIVAKESSYDKKSANNQWASQNPLGMQTVFQFQAKIGNSPPPEVPCTILKEMLNRAVTSSDRTGKDKQENHYGAGDGCVATALWSQGSAIATWDGGHHIDLNLFTFEENKQMHQMFSKAFLEMTSSFELISHNEQPRGSGRVISFKQEMENIF